MKAIAELIPQVFFDILARYVPGLVLFGSWILLFGQEDWSRLLSTVVGGRLDSGNALPTAALALLFLPFVVGYVIAPLAKAVQRGNERGWWLPPMPIRSVYEGDGRRWRPKYWWVLNDKGAGDGYDWLRKNASDAGALAAKIRAEFTMYNALGVAFLAITPMAALIGQHWWAVASGLAAPLMVYRGATTEETFHKTTRKLYAAARQNPAEAHVGPVDLKPSLRLIWLICEDDAGCRLCEDGKDWLDPVEPELKRAVALARQWEGVSAQPDPRTRRRRGKQLTRQLHHEFASVFVFRLLPSFWAGERSLALPGRRGGSRPPEQ